MSQGMLADKSGEGTMHDSAEKREQSPAKPSARFPTRNGYSSTSKSEPKMLDTCLGKQYLTRRTDKRTSG